MNEEKKRRWKWALPVLIAGLAATLLYSLWPEDRGRALRLAIFKGQNFRAKFWIARYPELVNATNTLPPSIAPTSTGSSAGPMSGMERLSVEVFEEITLVKLKRYSNLAGQFQGIENAGMSPLHIALLQNNAEVATLLINSGANVHAPCMAGATALHYAASWNNRPEILRLLLARGVDPNVTNRSGVTALFHAVSRNNEQNVRLLLAAGTDPNVGHQSGETVLHRAMIPSNARIISLLLKSGANPGKTNALGNTPLEVARKRDATNAVLVLEKL